MTKETTMDILGEVEKLAEQNPDKAREVVDKAEEIVDERTGNRFSDQVKQGGDFLEGQLGIQQQGN